MRLAFLLFQYSPHGGLQRDFRRLVAELAQRGHQCRIYCIVWQGEALEGVEIRRVPATAIGTHRRSQRFHAWVRADLARDAVDGVIGFHAMSGLDIYYATASCYQDETLRERGPLYGRSARHRHFATWEAAVFAPGGATQVLLLSASQRDGYLQHYHTPPQRMHLLPAGVALDTRTPPHAAERRKAIRNKLGVEAQELTLLFVASRFFSKGLDRAFTALAHLRSAQPSVKSRLLVAGQDKSRRFQRLARRMDIADGVEFLGGREDVGDLMLGADLLMHPARTEAAGTVLLEALAAGLPVVATEVCGYAQHVKAARAGILLPEPFSQEQLNRAVLRCIDGVYRAECRESALLYARLTDLYGKHGAAADLIEQLLSRQGGAVAG